MNLVTLQGYKWDLIKFKNIFHSKENHKQNKETSLRMTENMCKWSNQQKVNLQSIQTAHSAQYQKTNSPIEKWVDDLSRHLFKEDIQMAKKHMKRCSISLIIREKQIETIMRYHLTLVRKAIIKKSTNNEFWRGYRENETLPPFWWECILIKPLQRSVWRCLKKKNI